MATSAESWLIQVKNSLNSQDKMWHVSKRVCIYRVPKPLMNSNPTAYVPLVVSFGPYHHNINPKLSKMDQHKLEAVHSILARLKKCVTTLIAEIQNLEPEIRECYEEPIELDGEVLSLMLVMDACFILEFFRSHALQMWNRNSNSVSLVFQPEWNSTSYAVLNDILKLENQIPLCVLIKILELEGGTREHATKELGELLSNNEEFRGYPFVLSLDVEAAKTKLKRYMMKERPPYHLLDLFRMLIRDVLTNSSAESVPVEVRGRGVSYVNVVVPGCMQRLNCIDKLPCLSATPSPNIERLVTSTPTAELLHEAGVKFQPGKIRFEKRRFGGSSLSLPQIVVDDSTEIRLRNLMAYEECQRCSWSSEQTLISQYVILLDELIDSEKDVSVLRKSQVIESGLGSDEDIARMFNRLCDGITNDSITTDSITKLEEVKKEVRDHYNSQWKVWMSQLKKEHFSNPWKLLSVVAAILILGMTAVQAWYSVKK